MIGNALRGLDDLRRGATFVVARPRLWAWVAAPFALTLALFVAIAWVAYRFLSPIVDRMTAALPDWLGSVAPALLTVALVALLGAAAYFVFVAVATLISAPFNEMLSEAIEDAVTGDAGEKFSFVTFARDLVVGLVHALRRVSLYLVTTALLFALGALVPVLGPMAALALGALATARFTAFDAYDAVMARKHWSYADKRRFLSQHRARSTSLGAATGLMLIVPGLNLLALSFAAAGATLGYLDVASGPAAPASSIPPRRRAH